MQTAWKAIPTLSRMCAHCCSGLSAAHGSACAASIKKKLNKGESLTDAPERHAWQQPNGTGFELRARGLRVPCFAGCAPCEIVSADAGGAAGIRSIARPM